MWRCQANEIAMRRHFATSTGCRRRVTETGVPLNAMMAPQGYMITVYRFITNIFYEKHILRISSFAREVIPSLRPFLLLLLLLYEFCPDFRNANDNFDPISIRL